MMTKIRILAKIVGILFCAGCFLLSLVFSVNTYIVQDTDDRILNMNSASSGYDCILVLGAGVREDGTPTLMLKDRLEMGIALYKAGVSDRMLMSGDHGTDDYDEVNTMKDYAKKAGVPSEHIFMDHAGFSTYESIYRAKEVFCAEKIVIVTQQYHMYRALYIAEALGLDAVGVPAENIRYYGQTYREARELLARAKDMIYTFTKPEPTFLGEKISLELSGDITNDN